MSKPTSIFPGTRILEFAQVSRRYPLGETEVYGLKDVSLSFGSGEFTALAGPSGSGKSTLQHLGAGFDRPSSGCVRFLGQDLAAMGERDLAKIRNRSIGFVFQSFNLVPVLTSLENVQYPAEVHGFPLPFPGEPKDRARELLDRVGLGHAVHKRPNQLSGGQRQRVAIARALMNQPFLILADEPTANLDHETGAGILDLLEALNRETGCTILVATHDPQVIERTRRTVRLRDGTVVGDSQEGQG